MVYSWEGYVIEQIASYIPLITEELVELTFYRTREGTECDLVLIKGNAPFIAIEIKMTSEPRSTKGLTNAIRDLNTKHNFYCNTNM